VTKTRSHAALIGSRTDAFWCDPDELIIVGLDTQDGPEHPLYEPKIKRDLQEAAILNVMRLGVRKAVLVRKDGDRALLIDGRTRVRWAREANKRLKAEGRDLLKVRAFAERCSDEEAHDLMVSLNEVRVDETPIERANKLNRLIGRGRSEEEAAILYGVSLQTVKGLLAQLDLVESVQARVAAGELGIAEGKRLAALPRAEQEKVAAERVAAKAKKETPKPLPGEKTKPPKRKLVLSLMEKLSLEIGQFGCDFIRWSMGEQVEKPANADAIANAFWTPK
jgi:ParB family transcriptional regulator, chromosome partitioning protein